MGKRVPRTRGAGKFTEAGFWGWIRSALRKQWLKWPPRNKVLEAARRPNQSSNKRLKWEYKCARCEDHFPKKEVEVDHIESCGSLKCAEDLPTFVTRLFAEVDKLRVLCKPCHHIITHGVPQSEDF